MTKRFLTAMTAVSVGLWGPASLAASAETSPAPATVVQADPERSCAGEPATLTWTPPAGVADLTGYRIVHGLVTPTTPITQVYDVGADETSLNFTIPFGFSTFLIYAITSAGVASAPFTSAALMGNRAPFPMSWDTVGTNTVGDGTATVSYKWYGGVTTSTTGGTLPVTVRITASPGGASVDVPTGGSHSVTSTFSGLTNGVDYTFSAVTFNACGSSAPSVSPGFTPGLAPTWTRSTPPLDVGPGQYVYKFAAAGDPSPTYTLVGAPSWLEISTNGLVTGRPPAGTSSFSYSVVAGNGVGIHPFDRTDIVAGPFTVSVRAK
ncbi:MAG: hypothetical protein M3326_01770 [Actinomycetota bacterium]|nr:hypothetical protein [Actinomycetota bacterium]